MTAAAEATDAVPDAAAAANMARTIAEDGLPLDDVLTTVLEQTIVVVVVCVCV